MNSVQVEHIFEQQIRDPDSLDVSWHKYFKELEVESIFLNQHQGLKKDFIRRTMAVITMARGQQDRGHEAANLDPLELESKYPQLAPYKKTRAKLILEPNHQGLNEQLNDQYLLDNGTDEGNKGYNGGICSTREPLKLKDIVEFLTKTYCGNIGWEIGHLTLQDQKVWCRKKAESFLEFKENYPKEKKLNLLHRIEEVTSFEEQFRYKYPTAKRFGLEGLETIQVGLKSIVDHAIASNMDEIVIGMSHRGRLSVLHHTTGKPFWKIIREFTGRNLKKDFDGQGEAGDVKQHMWSKIRRKTEEGEIDIVCMPNPSHLDTVNPICEGYTRAAQKQQKIKSAGKKDLMAQMSIILHGDASFQGQGINYELMQMADLDDQSTGGTVHVICNNQIGFTTTPAENRHGLYSTVLGIGADVPVIHVNADCPIEVEYAFATAIQFRNKFHKDVIVDLIGQRRLGHNEIDTPDFTQPLMYKEIKNRPNIYNLYKDELIAEGILTTEEATKRWNELMESYQKGAEMALDDSLQYHDDFETLTPHWEGFNPKINSVAKWTGVDKSCLDKFINTLQTIPDGFNAHKITAATQKSRMDNWFQKGQFDWSTGEALSQASIIRDGMRVRLSGQDVKRGTFSNRHACIYDQSTQVELDNFTKIKTDNVIGTHKFVNSLLSEQAVLGFEQGYSIQNPEVLVIWEAQFGDFSNGAQIIIDNCIVSGESKWNLYSGIVINLPHGQDGQGPEHSSGRIERQLQLVDSDHRAINIEDDDSIMDIQKCNIQVCYPTTPANHFHMMRRQQYRTFRKPLIHFFSKKLLRHPLCVSSFEDIVGNTKFIPLLDDNTIKEPTKVKKVVFCTGQVWLDVNERREKLGIPAEVAIIRVEQLAPLDQKAIIKVLKKQDQADLQWLQEEHINQGAWGFMQPRLNMVLSKLNSKKQVACVARGASSASATGIMRQHEQEKEKLMQVLFEFKHADVLTTPSNQQQSEYL